MILENKSNMIISGKVLSGGKAAIIALMNCYNILLTHCKLMNSTDVAIYLYNCFNISIVYNYCTNVSTGVYALNCPKGRIQVNNNQFLNMQGPYPRGQFIQFNNVNGLNQIHSNKCENILGQSYAEDAISLYQCYGTEKEPITVKGNQIRGGGPSKSGGGIMLGDNGGAYQIADGNTLVNPGQYGIAISGGNNNSITNNIVYGAAQSFTNVGVFVESYANSKISNPTVKSNRVKYINAKGQLNGAWHHEDIDEPAGWKNNDWNANIDESVLPKKLITI